MFVLSLLRDAYGGGLGTAAPPAFFQGRAGGNQCISDHFPQFSILNNSAPDYTNHSHIVHDYKNFYKSQFLDEYQNMDFGF